ncbi:MAG: hypothetical protein WBV39_06465 [Rudaea sp.]
MSRARLRVEQANAELEKSGQVLETRCRDWREQAQRRHPWLLPGIGFASGFAFATLPPKWWSRLGSIMLGGGARLARSALVPVLLGPLWNVLFSGSRSRGPS